jgi:hypothetical protein
MKSFQIYLPGGKVPTRAGLVVIAVAVAAMIVGFTKVDAAARAFPGVTLAQLKVLAIGLGFAVIGIGWAILKVLGVPFAKDEKTA